jgi:hypothetical protein
VVEDSPGYQWSLPLEVGLSWLAGRTLLARRTLEDCRGLSKLASDQGSLGLSTSQRVNYKLLGCVIESLGGIRTAATMLLASAPQRRLCLVCTRATAKYTCPRCNMPYCCVPCFKAHATDCTERFYQQHVMDELKVSGHSDEDKRRMEDILRRHAGLAPNRGEDHHDEGDESSGGGDGGDSDHTAGLDGDAKADEDDDQDDDDDPQAVRRLVDRLEELALKPGLSLAELTEKERQQFMRAVLGGRLSSQIEPWKPWWMMSAAAADVVGGGGLATTRATALSSSSGGGAAGRSPLVREVTADQRRPDDRLKDPHPRGNVDTHLDHHEVEDEHKEEEAEKHSAPAAAAAAATAAVAAAATLGADGGDDDSPFSIPRFPLVVLEMRELCPLRKAFPAALRHNLVDLLCAYAYTLRLYNGDLTSNDPLGAAVCLVENSAVLAHDARFDTCAAAVDAFEDRLCGDLASSSGGGGGSSSRRIGGGGGDGVREDATVASAAAAAAAAASSTLRAVNVDGRGMMARVRGVLADVTAILQSPAAVQRAVAEVCKYLHRAYALATVWHGELKASQRTSKAGVGNPAAGIRKPAAQVAVTVGTAVAVAAPGLPRMGSGAADTKPDSDGCDDGNDGPDGGTEEKASYLAAWVAYLRANGVAPAASDASELKQQRQLLSPLRKKAMFYAAWARLLAMGQLRGIRTSLRECDDTRARAQEREQREQQHQAKPKAAASRRPKNYAIAPVAWPVRTGQDDDGNNDVLRQASPSDETSS